MQFEYFLLSNNPLTYSNPRHVRYGYLLNLNRKLKLNVIDFVELVITINRKHFKL